MSNNLRDHDGDKANGRRTLPILLGREKGVRFMEVMFAIAYLWVIVIVALGIITPWIVLTLLSIPRLQKQQKGL